jgi:tRNA A37 N6-isopentenylltransferase MiaA
VKNISVKLFDPIVYLTYPKLVDIERKILNRIERTIQLGLIEEIKTNLNKYRNTQFMKEGKFVVPIINYLDGIIDLNKAKKDMVNGAIDLIAYQKDEFSKYPDLINIENKNPEESLCEIIKLWNRIG